MTSLSRKGIVYGKVSAFGNIALYYDPETEFSYPSNIDILGNYPNPFNPSTNIYYVVQGEGDTNVNITILDLLGREVRSLYDGIRGVGYYEIIWDGTNNDGHKMGSGVYFISARIGDDYLYRKVMKLK